MRSAALWERRHPVEHLLMRFAVLWDRHVEHPLMRFAALWEQHGRHDPGDLNESLMRLAVL